MLNISYIETFTKIIRESKQVFTQLHRPWRDFTNTKHKIVVRRGEKGESYKIPYQICNAIIFLMTTI